MEPTKINKIENNDNILIYPNPCQDFTTIKFEQFNNQTYDIELYNSLGQVLISQKSFSNITDFQLDLTELESGVYILVFKNQSYHFSKTLIKK
jgi:hypothetical protein